MGSRGQTDWMKVVGGIGLMLSFIAALPFLPGATGAYLHHFQDPTTGTLVESVGYTVAIMVAVAVPTGAIGIAIAAVSAQSDF